MVVVSAVVVDVVVVAAVVVVVVVSVGGGVVGSEVGAHVTGSQGSSTAVPLLTHPQSASTLAAKHSSAVGKTHAFPVPGPVPAWQSSPHVAAVSCNSDRALTWNKMEEMYNAEINKEYMEIG